MTASYTGTDSHRDPRGCGGPVGKNEKANISKADTNGLARIAVGLKAWAKARHEEWLRQAGKS